MSHQPLRHYLSAADLTADETRTLLALAAKQKRRWQRRQRASKKLRGLTLAAIFEKPSLRTRTTLEVAMTQLGGHSVVLGDSIGLGVREPVRDVAANLSRWVQLVAARTFRHETITELAQHSTIPVINALSNREHPCQALADVLTLQEHLGELQGRTLVFLGDGNNIAHSLLLMGGLLGLNVTIATPPDFAPDAAILAQAQALAVQSGATIRAITDPHAAVQGADAIYTDVWASMGQESEAAARLPIFAPYQVNAALLAASGNAHALIMHDLPAHRGEEITAEVLDGPQSVIYDQAENRLHTIKALVLWLLGRA